MLRAVAEEPDRHDGEERREQEVDAEPARIAEHLPEQMADDRRGDPRQDHHQPAAEQEARVRPALAR